MEINERQVEGWLVLAPQGKITLGHGAQELSEAMGRAVDQGHLQLLLDCTGILFLDSSGLGSLVKGHMAVKAAGGEVRLFGVNSRVSSLLQMTNFHTVVRILATEEEALA